MIAATVHNAMPETSTVARQSTSEDFALVLGGPLYQIFRRAYLSGSALELLRRRTIVLITICWVPLLTLSILEGRAWGNHVSLPFIYDIDAHARFLIALPLIVAAELFVYQRMRSVTREFLERRLVPDNARSQFDQAIDSAYRLRNSVLAEVVLLAFVYGVGLTFIWRHFAELEVSSWYSPIAGTFHPSLAGWWFGLVSLPLFQFLFFRWYYRIFIWTRFLWQISRIKFDLLPTHPDRSAGLGFLSNVSFAFMPLLMAQGALLAGMMANRIFFTGALLTQFKLEIIGVVAIAEMVVLGPLLVFSPQLGAAKRTARREYGALAQRYVREFDAKWLRRGIDADEPLVGSSDIQSLADLGNSYQLIREMKWLPFEGKTMVQLAFTTIAPVLPLTLTVVPLDELLNRLLKIVF